MTEGRGANVSDIACYRPAPVEGDPARDDARWLALLLLEGLEVITKGIRRRYGLRQGVTCGRCGHKA